MFKKIQMEGVREWELTKDVIRDCFLMVGLWKIIFFFTSVFSLCVFAHAFFNNQGEAATTCPWPQLLSESRYRWCRIRAACLHLHSHSGYSFTNKPRTSWWTCQAYSLGCWRPYSQQTFFSPPLITRWSIFTFWVLIFQASNFLGPWPPGLIRSVQSCFMLEKNHAIAM